MKARSAIAALLCLVSVASAQAPSSRTGSGQQPPLVSPEVSAERKITFRIRAPKAESVRVSAGDIPGNGRGAEMSKDTNGVWTATVGPVPPGAYRYNFNVDGLAVIDPRNPATSESNNNTWSLVTVPGSELFDTKDVPHGSVAAVSYYSKSLKRFRRLHVYTPPGYENGKESYPAFYLLHGASDSDASWSSVGRAGFILDNLIAAGKAKPMIVVMPAGHVGGFRSGGPRPAVDEFSQDFVEDVMPLIDSRYRVRPGRQNRAMAGLSMGGGQTLNIGIPNLEKFSYLGVFSSGIFGITGNRAGATNAPAGPAFEERNRKQLADAKLKDGLKLFWFGTGKEDFLLETSRATVSFFKKHGFDVVYKETEGGHTWLVWRDYLAEFAPQLFQ